MKTFKKVLAAASASVVAASVLAPSFSVLGSADAADLTAVQLVEDMGLGWNLGNSLDSITTSWNANPSVEELEKGYGNIITTEAMIKEIKKSGFNTVRIPITWAQMIDSSGKPKDEFLARIKEVVDYCINNGMYAIINTHHDELSWLNNANSDTVTKFKALWTNIANYFKSYDQHLVFEGMNEQDVSNSVMMTLNQAFVDAVRATGGNNASRLLLVEAAANNTANALSSDFSAPTDAADMIAVSVHYYEPSTWCVAQSNANWGHRETWGSSNDYTILEQDLNKLESKFINNGIPVIIGEYGVANSDKYGVGSDTYNKDQESIEKFIKAVASTAYGKTGMCPVLWDDSDAGTMLYFSRKNMAWREESIRTIFADIAAGNSSDNGKTKTDRITFNAADVADTSDLLIDLKPYKDLGVTVNSVVLSYDLAFTGDASTKYGAGGAVQYNIIDNGEHWAFQNYEFTSDATSVTVDIPAETAASDDDGEYLGPLDMDYIKVSNWWYWTDPKGEETKVSHTYNKVTVIFSDYIYVDDIGAADDTTTVTTTATTAAPIETTTTAVSDPITVPEDAVGNAYFIGMLGADECWNIDSATGQKTAYVTGDGQYTVEWDIENGGTDTIQFLAIQINPLGDSTFTTDSYPELAITVDEVWIDGTQLTDYTTGEKAINTRYYDSDNPGVSRIYLHDDWNTKTNDVPSKTTVTQSVKVVFTVAGVDAGYGGNTLYGDANCDEKVNIGDAVAILQNLANSTKYPLTEQGQINADVDGSEGLTGKDAITIQQVDAKLINQSDLPLAG